MSLSVHQLFFRVVVSARVARVLPYRAMRPWLDAREPSIARIVAHEIDGQLAPYNQLFENRIAIASGAAAPRIASATVCGPIWPKWRYGESRLVPSISGLLRWDA